MVTSALNQQTNCSMLEQPYLPMPNFTTVVLDEDNLYQVQFDVDCWLCNCESFRSIGDCKHIDIVLAQIRQRRITQKSRQIKPISTIKNGTNLFVERNITHWRNSQAGFRSAPLTRNGQEPHTLWIGCADSRVPPELIIGALPGELFVHRNIGNMVPLPSDTGDCTTAVLNYALNHLPSVHNIVICGHSDCGAMKALVDPSYDSLEPELACWLVQAESILDWIQDQPNIVDCVQALVEANVLFQMQQLYHHQVVRERLQSNSLTLYGLIYDVTDRSLRKLVQFEERQQMP